MLHLPVTNTITIPSSVEPPTTLATTWRSARPRGCDCEAEQRDGETHPLPALLLIPISLQVLDPRRSVARLNLGSVPLVALGHRQDPVGRPMQHALVLFHLRSRWDWAGVLGVLNRYRLDLAAALFAPGS